MISLLERCLQLGAIATTVHHLLCFVRVIQSEVSQVVARSIFGDLGLSSGFAFVHLVQILSQQTIPPKMLICEFSLIQIQTLNTADVLSSLKL